MRGLGVLQTRGLGWERGQPCVRDRRAEGRPAVGGEPWGGCGRAVGGAWGAMGGLWEEPSGRAVRAEPLASCSHVPPAFCTTLPRTPCGRRFQDPEDHGHGSARAPRVGFAVSPHLTTEGSEPSAQGVRGQTAPRHLRAPTEDLDHPVSNRTALVPRAGPTRLRSRKHFQPTAPEARLSLSAHREARPHPTPPRVTPPGAAGHLGNSALGRSTPQPRPSVWRAGRDCTSLRQEPGVRPADEKWNTGRFLPLRGVPSPGLTEQVTSSPSNSRLLPPGRRSTVQAPRTLRGHSPPEARPPPHCAGPQCLSLSVLLLAVPVAQKTAVRGARSDP